jgi:hypothetical protein
MADELFANARMLNFGESREVLLPDLADKSPAARKLAIPHAANHIAFGVVVLAGVLKFVVTPRLTRAQRLRDREHRRRRLLEERLLGMRRGCRPVAGRTRQRHSSSS